MEPSNNNPLINRVLSLSEAMLIIEALKRLADVYDVLGVPEDAKIYRTMAEKLQPFSGPGGGSGAPSPRN